MPDEVGLLYDFANSLDQRRFVQRGVPHAQSDALATVPQLERWMKRHGLLDEGAPLDDDGHRKALALRDALRALLQLAPGARSGAGGAAARLNAAAADFPLIVQVSAGGEIRLAPRPGVPAGGLGGILAALQQAAATAMLDRLKTCASPECRWVFYDRSKPGSRRWCDSSLCGNREKTRAYRRRRHEREAGPEDAR
ncbi:MAG: CGNR zinc finger domain-containing protein [Alphaproteobacteria bacterium]|nr:CGNR zinc finger domain-containing protein [Alphaproteobacteria bacterium]